PAAARAAHAAAARARTRARAAGAHVIGRAAADAGASASATVGHGEVAPETLQHHLGGVFLGARIVRPFAGLERALDIELRALLHVFLDHIDQALVEDDDAVPLRALLALAGALVAPALRGRERE